MAATPDQRTRLKQDDTGAATHARVDPPHRPSEPPPTPAPYPGQRVTSRDDIVDVATLSAGQSVEVPLLAEELSVAKRTVETGQVIVHVQPRVERETLEVPLIEESIEVERVAVNRIVERAEPVRQEGDITIVPVYEEILVVEKRLMLKEEIRLVRRKVATQERQTFEVRKEEVHVLRTDPARPGDM